jgi:DNA replicative helicase MCM subunit Mcm2 (Cdc46/Mcm family)
MLQFRDLTADTMNKLIRIPGIVISASVLSSRATKLHLQCRACRSIKIIYPAAGLGGLGGGAERGLPRVCDAPEPEGQKKDCPLDPYLIVHSKSTFSDHQTLKLQEAPDMVPVGELPRHIILSADRYNTGQVVPGSRVIATGIYSTFNSSKNVCRCLTCVLWVNQCASEIRWCICITDAVPPSGSSRIAFICSRNRWSKPLWCPIHPRGRGRVQRDGQKRRVL